MLRKAPHSQCHKLALILLVVSEEARHNLIEGTGFSSLGSRSVSDRTQAMHSSEVD